MVTIKKKRHKSIDFNALIQKIDPDSSEITKTKERKCLSQMKPIITTDTNSVGKHSYDSR